MKTSTKLLLAVTIAACPCALWAGDSSVQRGAEVIGDPVVPVRIEVDLRDLPIAPAWKPGDPIKEIPRRRTRPDSGVVGPTDGRDPLLDAQLAADFGLDTTEVLNIAGQGFTGVNPPDTVGDAGPAYYIQAINALNGTPFVVYDKKDGSIAAGPILMQTLGAGGSCASGLGDPVVLYDEAADRWLLSEFATSGNRLCVYVSATPNPVSGGWCRYEFTAPGFPDYPKYGVWNDAYYVTTNEASPAVYAFDRANMIASPCGTARPLQRFTAPDLAGFPFQALTPADIDGEDLPAPGAPGLMMRHRDDEVHNAPGTAGDFVEVWAFHVDWTTPGNSTFTGPTNIPVSEFDSDLCGLSSFSCFPQPGGGAALDPLREVIMNRLAWRDSGAHTTLVGNFVTDVDGTNRGGERWFELRDNGTGWTLFQEGTYSPDAVNRWMGGIAMDSDGNILLGYNVSSGTVHPGLRYTGRESSDPPGTMSATESIYVAGSASNGSNRYGDYSSMSIDPEDDCTFWFTGEYNIASQWSTRIGAVKFEACGEPGFTLGVSPVSQTICAGAAPEYEITLGSVQAFNEAIQLSAVGNPAPSTVGFDVNPVPALPGASTMTVSNTAGVGFGTSLITISGLSNPSALTKSKDVSLTVYPTSPSAPVLSSPPDDAIDLPRAPNLQWAALPQAVDYFVEVATDAAFTNVIRSATVTAANWTVSPALDIATEYFWRAAAANPCGDSPASVIFSFTTGTPTILLVDDDDNEPDVLSTYTTLLDSFAAYDIWDVGEPQTEPVASDLAAYRAVVWFSGARFSSSTTPEAGPQTAAENGLRAYLDNGHCVLISSQDYLWDMGGPDHDTATPFMASHLGLAAATSDIGAYDRVDGENIYAGLNDMPLSFPFTDYPDILVTNSGGQSAFRGDLGSTNLGAISRRTPVYLSTFLSFPIEALSEAHRIAVMGRFLDTCEAQSVIFADSFEDQSVCDWSAEEPATCP